MYVSLVLPAHDEFNNGELKGLPATNNLLSFRHGERGGERWAEGERGREAGPWTNRCGLYAQLIYFRLVRTCAKADAIRPRKWCFGTLRTKC